MSPDRDPHYRKFLNVIRKSPFEELEEHNRVVTQSVIQVEEMLKSYIKGDFKEAADIAKKVSDTEYLADKIKERMRQSLPKSVFMPIDRGDILSVIHLQDEVSDYAEDVAQLLAMKDTVVPEELSKGIMEHFTEVVNTVNALKETIIELRDVIEASFAKKEIEHIIEKVNKVHHYEYKADLIERRISRELFQNIYDMDVLSVVHLLKIIDRADIIANKAEGTANRIQAMLAR